MSLFTGAYSNPLAGSPHPTMQPALEATRAALSLAGTPNVDRLALMVVALTGYEGTDDHPWAGIRTDEVHYSASLLKVAAMYAMFDLRASADQLATDAGHTTWPAVEADLRATFDPEIAAHTPALITGSPLIRPEDKTRRPNYGRALRMGSGGDFVVDFTPGQLAAFENMIVGAHSAGATTTIQSLGYPYLNGKFADDGFFAGSSGVWLAGDYADAGVQWPAARIPSVNDGPVAQATTAVHFARLLTLLFDGRLVGPLSSAGMQDLMRRADSWFHAGHVVPGPMIWPRGGRFVVTHTKVGVGPLKTGISTFSEGIVVRDTARELDFVVVWQNVHDTVAAGGAPFRRTFVPVATLVEATISAFV